MRLTQPGSSTPSGFQKELRIQYGGIAATMGEARIGAAVVCVESGVGVKRDMVSGVGDGAGLR